MSRSRGATRSFYLLSPSRFRFQHHNFVEIDAIGCRNRNFIDIVPTSCRQTISHIVVLLAFYRQHRNKITSFKKTFFFQTCAFACYIFLEETSNFSTTFFEISSIAPVFFILYSHYKNIPVGNFSIDFDSIVEIHVESASLYPKMSTSHRLPINSTSRTVKNRNVGLGDTLIRREFRRSNRHRRNILLWDASCTNVSIVCYSQHFLLRPVEQGWGSRGDSEQQHLGRCQTHEASRRVASTDVSVCEEQL